MTKKLNKCFKKLFKFFSYRRQHSVRHLCNLRSDPSGKSGTPDTMRLLEYYRLYSLCCSLQPHDCFYHGRFVLFNPFSFFTPFPSHPQSGDHLRLLKRNRFSQSGYKVVGLLFIPV